ncbi:glycoside hydrolase domain-containing protein [Saccharopolyspora shandongensis]|uniref:glycoside hydrolase domain-containing protein n=1 Tax=Saccharopolyspora shandongensis TaxID=418495 RepID=UPI003426B0FB
MRGLDYSAGVPKAAAVKAAGFDFVVRYVGTPGRRKNITAGEYRDMTGAGVGVALVFENRAGDALAGRAAGARNARAALDDANSFGWPADRPIYMAVDQDITTESQMRTVVEYLRGAADVLGIERIGVYGEADVVDRAQRDNVARWFWQTKAWSRKRISPHAHLVQQTETVRVDGVECDINTTDRPDIGQHPRAQENDLQPDERNALLGVHGAVFHGGGDAGPKSIIKRLDDIETTVGKITAAPTPPPGGNPAPPPSNGQASPDPDRPAPPEGQKPPGQNPAPGEQPGYLVSIVRTVLPAAWGALIAWLVSTRLLPADLGEQAQTLATTVLVPVAGALIYAAARWLETRPGFPRSLAHLLLGSAQVPNYPNASR